jgi:hypothetical protein
MASAITSESDANRSGIFVEEGEERAVLTVYARNRLVSCIVGLLGAFPTLGALSSGSAAMAVTRLTRPPCRRNYSVGPHQSCRS